MGRVTLRTSANSFLHFASQKVKNNYNFTLALNFGVNNMTIATLDNKDCFLRLRKLKKQLQLYTRVELWEE